MKPILFSAYAPQSLSIAARKAVPSTERQVPGPLETATMPTEQVDILNVHVPAEPQKTLTSSHALVTPALVRTESLGATVSDMVSQSPSPESLEVGANGQIFMFQDNASANTNIAATNDSRSSIDGFLAKFLPETKDASVTSTLPTEQRLISDEQTFPSLEPGTRHRVSRVAKPEGYPDRGAVPENWSSDYKPTAYVSPQVIEGPKWAETTNFNEALAARIEAAGVDPKDPKAQDVKAFFPSYEGSQIADGKPRNPRGPTGISGQGLLGKHGANPAADPVVFRRHRDPETGETKLQMIAIQRKDNGNWAIPGGMADFGESVSGTLGRELREEALGDKATPEQAQRFDDNFKTLFDQKGTQVYQGAVDDFRNTDTSWMETSVNMVELTPDDAQKLGWDMNLTAGDDAADAKWMDVNEANLKTLNANHGEFVGKSVQTWQKQTGMVVSKDGGVFRTT